MKKKILWASPHKPTEKQLEDLGTVEYLEDINPNLFGRLVDSPSNREGLYELAEDLLSFAQEAGYDVYQPAGSPAFQFILGRVIATTLPDHMGGLSYSYQGVNIKYAHSKRVSFEVTDPDGSVKKTVVFNHLGWI